MVFVSGYKENMSACFVVLVLERERERRARFSEMSSKCCETGVARDHCETFFPSDMFGDDETEVFAPVPS